MPAALRGHRAHHRQDAAEGEPAGYEGGEGDGDRAGHEDGNGEHVEDEISAVVMHLAVVRPLRREEPRIFDVVHDVIVSPGGPPFMNGLAAACGALNELATKDLAGAPKGPFRALS